MTTAYMTRATYLTFFGKARGGAAHFVNGHEDHSHDEAADEVHHDVDGHDTHAHVQDARSRRSPRPGAARQATAVRPRRFAVADHRAALILGFLARGLGLSQRGAVQAALLRALARVVHRPAVR